MELLDAEKKRICEFTKNDYYNNKFYNLELEKRKSNYKRAVLNLKNTGLILAVHNSNIYIYDSSIGQYGLIQKEHFSDSLDDEQKENYYRKIKRFTDDISKATLILDEWHKELETYEKDYFEKTKAHPKPSIRMPHYLATKYFHQILFDAQSPHPIQHKQQPVLNGNIAAQHPSKDVVDFLYQLCDGDIKNLQNIAKLSYNLIYNPKDCLANVILASEEIYESLREYFNLLLYPRFINQFDELGLIDSKTMRLKDNRIPLLEHEFKGDLPIILINGNTIYKKGEVHSFFKKLFTGKNQKINNPYFDGELNLINTIPLVCLVNDAKKYRALKNLYNINGIEIKSKELISPEKSSKSADWLRKEFLCIGQKQVKINPKMAIPYEINHKKIVQRFIRICCTFGEGKDCTKRDLHKAFEKYLEHCYPDEEALTQGTLSGIVKELKYDRVIVRRIHDGRGKPYLDHFIGMGLKENYSELYKDEPVHVRAKTEKEKFEIILNNLVKETFNDVQLNKRRVEETIDIIK